MSENVCLHAALLRRLLQQVCRCPRSDGGGRFGVQVSLAAEHIRNEKVKVLRSMKRLSMDDVVVGQYRGRAGKENKKPGYLDDDTVPEGRSAQAYTQNPKPQNPPCTLLSPVLCPALCQGFPWARLPCKPPTAVAWPS